MVSVTYEELDSEKVKILISNNDSFEITGLSGRMGDAVLKIEKLIESQGLSCRIYTYARTVAAGGSILCGVAGVLGIASMFGMAGHNVATFNPDYEVAKHFIDNKLSVKYKK